MTRSLQIGNLFGSHRATVMTALSGCIDSSSFVMLLIKVRGKIFPACKKKNILHHNKALFPLTLCA